MALPDAVVVLDDEAQVQWANAAASKYLGIKWPEDVNQRITNLVRMPELREFLQQQNPEMSTEIASPTDQRIHLSVRIAPYGKNQWLFVARDVTELHQVNQIRSDFVANVSHELRTPITVFKGYLENMEDQAEELPKTWSVAVEQMTSHVERMHSIIEELLLLSRLEQSPTISNPSPVDVSALLTVIHREAQLLGRDKHHLFSFEVDNTLWINGDQGELHSAFSNLVVNAVIYTEPRGVIKVRWQRTDAGACLEVNDNGPGVPAEHLPRLTERFYRVDQSRSRESGGTGLGLAIVKHVLQRHGASLAVESEVGVGSSFRCEFPHDRIVVNEPEREEAFATAERSHGS